MSKEYDELVNRLTNPPPRQTPAQVFAELQKKLDDDALKEHYIALERRLQTEHEQARAVLRRFEEQASEAQTTAKSEALKAKLWRGAFIVTCPALLLFLCIELARHGL